MKILSPAGRRALRAKAHHLHPFVTIGQHGLTAAVLHEIDVNLAAHELIKIRVFDDDRAAREATLERICAELDAAPIQHIGKLLIVWRPAPKEEPSHPAARHEASRPAARPPAEKSAAKKAPQSRRPRSPLPRTPARPPRPAHRHQTPAATPAGPRSRRGKSAAPGAARPRAPHGKSATGTIGTARPRRRRTTR
jgi:RNA-binding protein